MPTHQPRWKIMRRFGLNLYGTRSPGLEKRITVPPGQHGRSRRSRPSEYALQLREKQKTRFMYGATERQFQRTFERARRLPGRTGEAMISLLERRLDNVTYRLGFAPTRPMARQLVSHGHVLVNGKRVTIASYEVRVGEVLTLGPKAREIPDVQESLKSGNPIPAWLQRRDTEGVVTGVPTTQDFEVHIEPQRIVEFYSR